YFEVNEDIGYWGIYVVAGDNGVESWWGWERIEYLVRDIVVGERGNIGEKGKRGEFCKGKDGMKMEGIGMLGVKSEGGRLTEDNMG
ncbi:hypothetical protein, partial [Neisseria sicca]|uniref:hypothetical protein n=1 Tax=Neisseria sicca TaxID=490 RepID=UPI00164990FC